LSNAPSAATYAAFFLYLLHSDNEIMPTSIPKNKLLEREFSSTIYAGKGLYAAVAEYSVNRSAFSLFQFVFGAVWRCRFDGVDD
jgi:hypothetical protein